MSWFSGTQGGLSYLCFAKMDHGYCQMHRAGHSNRAADEATADGTRVPALVVPLPSNTYLAPFLCSPSFALHMTPSPTTLVDMDDEMLPASLQNILDQRSLKVRP